MTSSIKLGRILGVDVGIHWSWIFIFFFVTWSFATGVLDSFYPQWSAPQLWIGGAFVASIFFLSVLAHELSHAIVSNRNGLPVRSITLFIFGGVANLTKEPDSAGLEFRIAIIGPITSLALGGGFALLFVILRPFSDGLAGISANLALINASLAVFNMLPGFPLDGGRVFRSIIWARNENRLRATRIAAKTGEWIAYGMMALGIGYTYFGGIASGLWFLFIGFFLRNASSASYEQLVLETALKGIPVRDVMQTEFSTVPPDLSVADLVREHVLRHSNSCFVVMAGGNFAGIITLADVRNVPHDQWQSTSVYRAMTPLSRLHTIDPSASLSQVLHMMGEHGVSQLPVVHGHDIVGILHHADILRYVQVRRDLSEHMPPAPPAPESEGRRGDEVGSSAPHR